MLSRAACASKALLLKIENKNLGLLIVAIFH